MMTKHIFKLEGVRSHYNGEHYIGFVLDVIREYIGWKVEYYCMSNGNTMASFSRASMSNAKGGRIVIVSSEENVDEYFLFGFPADRDFKDFKRVAERLLEKVLGK